MSRLSSLFLRSSVRPSGPDDEPRRKPFRTVRLPPSGSYSWESQVEIQRPFRRSVSWNTHVQVFIFPAWERTLDDCDPCFESEARDRALEDCNPHPKSFDDDDEPSIASPCEDDTLTPCAEFSDDHKDFETKRDAVG